MRSIAAETAGRLGDTAAVATLLPLLDDDYWQVRLKAIRSLGILRSREAVARIGATLAGSISNLRKEAAAALGEIADPGSLALLRRYEDDADPDVRKTIRWAIGRIR